MLAHILVEPVAYGDPSIAADTTIELFEQGRKWVEDEIEKWASGARAAGITVRTIVRTGLAQEEIVNLATDERAELIIIGTHGRTGLNRLLLGSIADRVIRFAPCPGLDCSHPARRIGSFPRGRQGRTTGLRCVAESVGHAPAFLAAPRARPSSRM